MKKVYIVTYYIKPQAAVDHYMINECSFSSKKRAKAYLEALKAPLDAEDIFSPCCDYFEYKDRNFTARAWIDERVMNKEIDINEIVNRYIAAFKQ